MQGLGGGGVGYRTVSGCAEAAFIEKKSEFIGSIAPVVSDEEAAAFIAQTRAAHRKARHSVYAYLLRAGNTTRFTDDGEPQGTAGAPVLEVLKKEGLTDVCVIVTRYFGGILLGGGGLVRAYSHAAKLAVDAAKPVTYHEAVLFELCADYTLYGRIAATAAACGAKVVSEEFAASVTMRLHIRVQDADAFVKALANATNGQAHLSEINKVFAVFDE
ncbi:MAG: YigZ family protein [Oscillospiraceae bacterium]